MTEEKKKFTSMDEYLASCSEAQRERLKTIRAVIREEVPEAEETISYQIPAFKFRGTVLYASAAKKHTALYPVTPAMEADIPGLADYPTSGKGTVRFPHNRPLPLPLIREIIAWRINEAQGKHATK